MDFESSTKSCNGIDQEGVPVQMEPLFSCDKWESDFEDEDNLSVQRKNIHDDTDCIECVFNVDEDTVLKDHKSDCNHLIYWSNSQCILKTYTGYKLMN